MTFMRLVIILVLAMVILDTLFNSGQILAAIHVQMTQLGYWLGAQFSYITRLIAPFR